VFTSENLGVVEQEFLDQVGREVRDAVPTDLRPEQADFLQMAGGGDGLGSEVVQDGAE